MQVLVFPQHPGKCPLWSSTNTYHCTCLVNKHLEEQRMYSQLIPTGAEDLFTGHLESLALVTKCHFCVPKSSLNMYLRVNTKVYIVSKWMFSWENFEHFLNPGLRATCRPSNVVSEFVYIGHILTHFSLYPLVVLFT